MNLRVFNGSPRGLKSNTRILLNHFEKGFLAAGEHRFDVTLLLRERKPQEWLRNTREADVVLLAFPLYADAMPAIVKEYLEAISPLRDDEVKPTLMFLVQSGFPEAAHSRFVARYLEKVCRRLKVTHGGTLVRGGVEGIQVMPTWMTKKALLPEISKARISGKVISCAVAVAARVCHFPGRSTRTPHPAKGHSTSTVSAKREAAGTANNPSPQRASTQTMSGLIQKRAGGSSADLAMIAER